jgi:hypothetical protein
MAVASTKPSKYELALYVAGGIALACLDRVSPVGVIGVGERKIRIQPSLARPRVLQWLLELRKYRYDEGTSSARGSRARADARAALADRRDLAISTTRTRGRALKRLSATPRLRRAAARGSAERLARRGALPRARGGDRREILAKGRRALGRSGDRRARARARGASITCGS